MEHVTSYSITDKKNLALLGIRKGWERQRTSSSIIVSYHRKGKIKICKRFSSKITFGIYKDETHINSKPLNLSFHILRRIFLLFFFLTLFGKHIDVFLLFFVRSWLKFFRGLRDLLYRISSFLYNLSWSSNSLDCRSFLPKSHKTSLIKLFFVLLQCHKALDWLLVEFVDMRSYPSKSHIFPDLFVLLEDWFIDDVLDIFGVLGVHPDIDFLMRKNHWHSMMNLCQLWGGSFGQNNHLVVRSI